MEESRFFIAKATIKVAFASLILYLFWYLREYAISDRFGISEELDAFLIAYSIPIFLGTILMTSLQTVLVPLYLEVYQEGGISGGARFRDQILSWLFIFSLAGMAALIGLAYPLIHWIGAGLSHKMIGLSIQLYLIQIPLMLFCGVYGLVSAILTAEKRYLTVTLLPAVSSLVPAMMVWLFHPYIGIYSLAWGFVLGWGIQSFIGCWFIFFNSPFFRFNLLLNGRVRETFTLSLPLILGLVGSGLIPLIDRNAASFLPSGSIAALGYAERVFQLLVGLFASIQMVIFPIYSKQILSNQLMELKKSFANIVLFAFWICIPIAMILWFQAIPFTQFMFKRGAFDEVAVTTTGYLIAAYGLALVFTVVGNIFVKVLNASKDSIGVGLLGMLNPLLKYIGNLLFIPYWGLMGFPLAYFGMSFIVMVLLYVRVRKKLAITFDRIFWLSIGKILLAALLTIILYKSIEKIIRIDHSTYWYIISSGMLLFYMAASWLLNIELFREVVFQLKQRAVFSKT